MKKLFLLSLVASIASVAATTGHVKAFNENSTDFAKDAKVHEGVKTTKSTFGLETEVKVADSGFSFGGLVKAKELGIFTPVSVNDVKTTVKAESSVWAKYELPELMGVNSYVKAKYATKGETVFEADANYKVLENVKVGLNTITTVNFTKPVDGDQVTSTQKVYAKGDYMMVKGIEAELGLKHDWKADKDSQNYSLKEVFLKAKGSYEDIKDVKLTGEFMFKHALADVVKVEFDHFMPEIEANTNKAEGLYSHSYALTANYTAIKDFELSAKGFVQHVFATKEGENAQYKSTQFLHYGIMPEVTYKGIENLTLSSKNLLSGITVFTTDMTQQKEEDKHKSATAGLFKLNAMAEYTYKATDKLTVKPSADVTALLFVANDKVNSLVTITPAVNVEYKANNNLTVSGGLKSKSSIADGTYTNTNVKTNLEVKYTW